MAESFKGERIAMDNAKSSWVTITFGVCLVIVAVCGTSNDSCDYTKIGLWRNCGYSNTTSDDCLKQNCCYATDKFANSKNLTQHCVRQPQSFEWKNGTCNIYNGTVCLDYLGNSTMNKEIFFDIKYGVNGTERILKQFIDLSHLFIKNPEICRHLVPTGICQMMLPQCNAEGRPLFPCREDCDYIHKICDKELIKFYGALELHQARENIKFSHLAMPSCPDFKYSYEYAKNETCTFVGTFPCVYELTASNGTIRPHVSYGKYMPNHNCTWYISVPEGNLVQLKFTMIDLEKSSGCINDSIVVKDGLQQSSATLGTYCGRTAPGTIISSSNKVSIQFITNSREEASGFIVQYAKTSPVKKSSGSTDLIVVVAIVCSVVAVIFLLTVVACKLFTNSTRKLKEKNAQKDMELFATFTTVRDRIRQDSMPNPLVEALAKLSPDQKPPQCRLDRMEYVKDLGQGQFGKVFQGRYKLTENGVEMSVAVKMLKEGSSSETKESFSKEVTLMTVLQHENILRLLAVSMEEEPFCMVFEFMPKGDLNEYLRKHDPENTGEPIKDSLPIEVLIDMAKQIAKGMEYLSSKRFIHRDLATRNCLVGDENVVKIADFGMSRDVYESDYYKVGGAVMLPIRWMPPEALIYGKFTVESDVYSYGILLWEIFTYALQPFYGYSNDEVVNFIRKGVILPKPDICPQEIYDYIMTRCWYKEPEKRLTFTEIYKRLDGDYDFSVNLPTIPQKGKEIHAYTTPPSLKQESNEKADMKRIPSKKDTVGPPPQYVNFEVENDTRDARTEAIPLGIDSGGCSNPLYRSSVIASDLYDVPKSLLPDEEAYENAEGINLQMAALGSRNNVIAEDLYDRPKSIPVDVQLENETGRKFGDRPNMGCESDLRYRVADRGTEDFRPNSSGQDHEI